MPSTCQPWRDPTPRRGARPLAGGAESENPASSFRARDLRINLSKTGPLVDRTDLKPGATRTGTVTVTNAEHKAKLTLSATGLSDTPPGPSLADVIRVTVREPAPSSVERYRGTLDDLDAVSLGTLANGAQRAYQIEIHWPAGETDASLAGVTTSFVFDWGAQSVP